MIHLQDAYWKTLDPTPSALPDSGQTISSLDFPNISFPTYSTLVPTLADRTIDNLTPSQLLSYKEAIAVESLLELSTSHFTQYTLIHVARDSSISYVAQPSNAPDLAPTQQEATIDRDTPLALVEYSLEEQEKWIKQHPWLKGGSFINPSSNDTPLDLRIATNKASQSPINVVQGFCCKWGHSELVINPENKKKFTIVGEAYFAKQIQTLLTMLESIEEKIFIIFDNYSPEKSDRYIHIKGAAKSIIMSNKTTGQSLIYLGKDVELLIDPLQISDFPLDPVSESTLMDWQSH